MHVFLDILGRLLVGLVLLVLVQYPLIVWDRRRIRRERDEWRQRAADHLAFADELLVLARAINDGHVRHETTVRADQAIAFHARMTARQ